MNALTGLHSFLLGKMALLVTTLLPLIAQTQIAQPCPCLISDDADITQSSLPAPAYRQTIYDPKFGVNLTRVTGDSGELIEGASGTWPDNVLRHKYSSFGAWNADGSLLWLNEGGKLIIDGNTFEPTNLTAPVTPGNYWPRWSPTNPDDMYIFRGNSFYIHNIYTGEETEIMTVPGFSNLRMEIRSSPSYDGTVVGAKGISDIDGRTACMLLNLETQEYSTPIYYNDYDDFDSSHQNPCGATPTGKYLWIDGVTTSSNNNNAYFFDWFGNLVLRINPNDGVECPGSHGDLGINVDGDDVFVGGCKGGTGELSSQFQYSTVSYRIKDGYMHKVGKKRYFHVSCQNAQRPGYCYGSNWGSDQATVTAMRLESSGEPVEEFVTSVFNNGGDYAQEVQASVAPDGTKLVFTSDWNGALAKPHAIVAEFAAQCEALDCPTIGSACSDGNPETLDDQADGKCNCVGLPIDDAICSVATPPGIDGVDDEWSQRIHPLTNVLLGTVSSSSDLNATFQVSWDNDKLYVFGSVQDNILINDSSSPWQDDSFEIYIDGGNEKNSSYDANDHLLVFGYNDPVAYDAFGGETNPNGVDFQMVMGSKFYNVEIAVSWSFIGIAPPDFGDEIGLDIHINDDDDGNARDKRMSWFQTDDESWTHPPLFKTMTMSACEDCIDAIELFSSPIASGTYHASYNVEADQSLQQVSVVNFNAGDHIQLLPGFEVEMGAVFSVQILPCD